MILPKSAMLASMKCEIFPHPNSPSEKIAGGIPNIAVGHDR